MNSFEMHPIATEVISAFARHDYFRSNRFTTTLADRHPRQCLKWTLNLVGPCVDQSAPPDIVAKTLSASRAAAGEPSADALPLLDDLSEQSWCSGTYDDSRPFLQRAVARVGWAAMCLICATTGAQFTGIRIAKGKNATLKEMSKQCAMAVDMTFTDTEDGRLMVASSFSRAMDALS